MVNIFILLTGSLIIIGWITLRFYNIQQKKRRRQTYREALFGGDIQKAIDAGRAYYSKRGREISQAEERAIQRDLEKNGLSNLGNG
jgi:hypothetical protein